MTNAVAPVLAQGNEYLPVLIVVILLALVVVLPRMARRKPSGGRTVGTAVPSVRGREQMEDLLVKLHDISREMQAKLDTKMRVLNRLIEEANEKIRELDARGIKEKETKSDKASGGTRDVAQAPPRPETGKYASVYELADAGHDVVSISRRTGLQPGEIELLLELRKKRNKDRQ